MFYLFSIPDGFNVSSIEVCVLENLKYVPDMQHFVGKEENKNQTLTTFGPSNSKGEILRSSLHVKYLQIIWLPSTFVYVYSVTWKINVYYLEKNSRRTFFRCSDFDLMPSGTWKFNDWLLFVFLYELVGHKFKYVTSYHFQSCSVGSFKFLIWAKNYHVTLDVADKDWW